jgi:hypothetical protein
MRMISYSGRGFGSTDRIVTLGTGKTVGYKVEAATYIAGLDSGLADVDG